jgi:outer membrane lipoprotein-sorting protein
MSLLRPGLARRLAWILLPLSLFAAVAAWAGPKEDMKALSVKFLALRSYHVVIENSDKRVPKMEMDFVAPDRYRMQMPMGTQIVIGDTMYMTIDGRAMKIPMPKGTTTQWRESDRAFREVDRMQIEELGTELVEGKPTKKYRMVQTAHSPATTSLIWVGANGYPVKMETTGTAGKRTSTVTVRYSRFNDPSIRIDIPK